MLAKNIHRLSQVCLIVLLLGICAVATAAKPGQFSVVVLPDTQNYAELFPDTYVAQTNWIKRRVDPDNIKFVIHLGDIVQNAHVEKEWEVADRAFRVLDGVVPYSVVPGNHDMDTKDKKLTRSTSFYDKFFPPTRFNKYPWYGGYRGTNNQNNYCLFEANGLKFLVLSLEFAPSDAAIEWATGVLSEYRDRRIILVTHCYMRPNGRDQQATEGYGLTGNSGQQVWGKLVRKHANIFLVLSGHVLGVAHQTSTNDAGGPVHEVLVDYQGLPNGGDGWLQILRFAPTENRIRVEAYSPLLGQHNRAPEHSYSLDYGMNSLAKKKAQ